MHMHLMHNIITKTYYTWFKSLIMEKRIIAFIYILGLFCIFSFYNIHAQQVDDIELQTYIVHVSLPEDRILTEPHEHVTYYESFLPEASVSSNGPTPLLVYSYNHVATGFAAKLTAVHAKSMEKKEGFLSARLQKILTLHTTHTPKFLGLHQNLGFWQGSTYGEGVIVGILDTGITPNHPSFNDEGMPPPPKKWKGKCEFGKTLCNNKLIGARSFGDGPKKTPLDNDGHGTHTSSTAVGNFVKGANVLGQANGTAVGMAPLAHVAIYQVCDDNGCNEADILAAMDTAIDDGVDILSLSLGGNPVPFNFDGIALGAFSAIRKGIFVSCSAGNSGPSSATVSNGAPWILTVGASTMDRKIRSTAVLGNKKQYNGETIFQPNEFLPTPLPLVYAGLEDHNSTFCGPGSFNNTDVKGKVVLCERGGGIGRIAKGQEVKDAGGAGMILMNDVANAYSTLADPHVLPAVHVSYAAGLKIREYINSTTSPTAQIIFKGTVIGDKTAPEVTSFSSRGPNMPSPGILKPDIIGPGVSVLAAWPISVDNKTGTPFNIISGTSMSCPHLSGIAALLKTAHPEWSPAAIKSAIMTTSDITNLENNLILDENLRAADLFAVGAGHVNPARASDPGLIYDIKPDDYVPYLCGLNYNDTEVRVITNTKVKCSEVTAIPEAGLNYPSFSVALGMTNLTYTRIVTNVGPAKSFYESSIINPPGVEVTVKPKTLEFSEENEKLTYEVTFSRSLSVPSGTYVQGYMAWSSNTSVHYALSPLSVQLI